MENTSRQLMEIVHTSSGTKFRVWLTEYEISKANSGKLKERVFTWKTNKKYEFLDELTNKYYCLHKKHLVTSVGSVDLVEVSHVEDVETSKPQPEQAKIWTFDTTKLLISLVKNYDNEFESKVKKHVWIKIATNISNQTKVTVSAQQCDTKWKGLKNMYKNIKQHNEKSGNDHKEWKFFNDMDKFMYKKPEIVPPVICSSSRGLQINSEVGSASTDDYEENTTDCNGMVITPKRTGMARKRIRRYENAVDKRHMDKMQRQDRFLGLFEDMVNIMKNKESK